MARRGSGAARRALLQAMKDAKFEQIDRDRTEYLNRRMGVCEECGKWAFKHYPHCSHRNDPVDKVAQAEAIAFALGTDWREGP